MTERITLKNTRPGHNDLVFEPDPDFPDGLLATVDGSVESDLQRDRWPVFKLYRTNGGTHVLSIEGHSVFPDEKLFVTSVKLAGRDGRELRDEITHCITSELKGRGRWVSALLFERAGLADRAEEVR